MDSVIKAALYIRVSTEEQANEGLSVDAQIETLTQYCRLYNIEVYNIYKDLGISGKSTKNRPALRLMLQDAAMGYFNMVLVWKISRLSRSLKDLLILLDELEKHNIVFSSYSEKFDTSTPVGRMTLQLLGSIAEFERNTIIENVKLGLTEYARKGGKTGTVLGYDNMNRQLHVNIHESETVKLIFHLYTVERLSMTQIAERLNLLGLKTKRKNKFNKDSIEVILSNPVYIGQNRHKIGTTEEYHTQGIHQPIIEQDVWEMAQQLRNRNKTKRSSIDTAPKFLLSGFIICPKCKNISNGFTSGGVKKQYRYYKCKNCKSLYNADVIESAVINRFKDLLLSNRIATDVIKYLSEAQLNTKMQGEALCTAQEIQNCSKLIERYLRLLEQREFQNSEAILYKIVELEHTLHSLKQRESKLIMNENPCHFPSYHSFVNHICSMENKSIQKDLLECAIEGIELDVNGLPQKIHMRFAIDGTDHLTL